MGGQQSLSLVCFPSCEWLHRDKRVGFAQAVLSLGKYRGSEPRIIRAWLKLNVLAREDTEWGHGAGRIHGL